MSTDTPSPKRQELFFFGRESGCCAVGFADSRDGCNIACGGSPVFGLHRLPSRLHFLISALGNAGTSKEGFCSAVPACAVDSLQLLCIRSILLLLLLGFNMQRHRSQGTFFGRRRPSLSWMTSPERGGVLAVAGHSGMACWNLCAVAPGHSAPQIVQTCS